MALGNIKNFEEIEKEVFVLDYKLLSFYKTNKNIRVIIKDSSGYMYDSFLSRLGKFEIEKFHVLNPYTLKNISLWLKLNNKNFKLCEDNVYIGSHKKLNFHCFKCEEDFIMGWSEVYSGNNCGVCRGRQVKEKFSLAYLRPDLAQEFSFKNKIDAKNVLLGNHKRFLWQCKDCNHEWETTIPHRVIRNNGCPMCSGRLPNDNHNFSVLFSELLIDWNESKNGSPLNYSPISGKLVWWMCHKCQHEWQTKLCSRTGSIKRQCPACSQKVLSDKNRLSLTHKELCKEWDYTKNNDLKPENVSYGMKIEVWWKCNLCKKSWKTFLCDRARRNGYSKCSCINTSKIEKIVENILIDKNIIFESQKVFADCKYINSLRFDFYLFEYNLLIEVQGIQHYKPIDFANKGTEWANELFRKNQIKDQIKRNYCYENSINFLEIPYWEFDSGNVERILIEYLNM